MTKKLSIGVIAVALLLSGAMVSVSFGGDRAAITQPEVVKLKFEDRQIEFLPLVDSEGKWGGQVTLIKRSLFDLDGNLVGIKRVECTAMAGPGWICTIVSSIKDGPNTDKGTVVATGVYNGQRPSSTFAVIGGTGAYENVGGYASRRDTATRCTWSRSTPDAEKAGPRSGPAFGLECRSRRSGGTQVRPGRPGPRARRAARPVAARRRWR